MWSKTKRQTNIQTHNVRAWFPEIVFQKVYIEIVFQKVYIIHCLENNFRKPGAHTQPAIVKKKIKLCNCKNSAALLKTTSVKKVVRSNGGQEMAAMV